MISLAFFNEHNIKKPFVRVRWDAIH